jgi:hypothetical protein
MRTWIAVQREISGNGSFQTPSTKYAPWKGEAAFGDRDGVTPSLVIARLAAFAKASVAEQFRGPGEALT